MSFDPDAATYVTKESGALVHAADVPHHRRVQVCSDLEAERIQYRFGAPPLTTGSATPSNRLRLFVERADVAAARRIVQKGATGAMPEAAADRDTEVTRMLCATAVRSPRYARSVLAFLKTRGVAAAPESGIDVPLLAQVCSSMEDRSRQASVLFFAVLGGSFALTPFSVWLGMALFLLATASLSIAYAVRDAGLTAHFRKGRFSRDAVAKAFPVAADPEVAAGFPDPAQNLIVYRWFSPFVGAGLEQGGWTFTIDVEKGADDGMGAARAPLPFTDIELHDRILAAIRELQLPNTTVQDIAFVFGEDVRNDRRILPDVYGRPVQRFGADEICRYRETNDQRVRCYPCVRIHDWESQIVISQFIRLNRHGKHLSVEMNRYLLTPIRQEFRGVDAEPPMTVKRWIMLVIHGAIAGPFHALAAPLALGRTFAEMVWMILGVDERRYRRAIDDNPRSNHGNGGSMRESASGGSYTRYFQKQDAEMYARILQSEIMETILEFLEAHQIDISELREQRTTILNSGVIVSTGGNLNASSLAVGANSAAKTSNPLQRLRRAVASPTQRPKSKGAAA